MEQPDRLDVREKRLWSAVLGRGSVALLFAVLAMSDPWMPTARLAKLFAAYALADGALMFYTAPYVRQTHRGKRARPFVLEGIVSVGAAVLAVVFPVTAALRIIGGLRGLVVGASDVIWSRHDEANEFPELGGIALFALSILTLAWPGPGVVALPWLLGLPAFVSGGLFVAGSLSQFRRANLIEGSS